MLTNVQRQSVSDFLVTLTTEIPPVMLLKLLRQLTVDLAALNEYSNVALRVSHHTLLGLPRFPVPEPGNSVVPGTREPGIWSGSKTVPGQAFLGKNYV